MGTKDGYEIKIVCGKLLQTVGKLKDFKYFLVLILV